MTVFNSGHDKACHFSLEILSMLPLEFTFNHLSQNCCWLNSTSIVEFAHSHQNKCFLVLPHKFSLSKNLSRSQKRGVFKFFSPFCGEKALSSDMFPRLPKHFCEQGGTGNFLYSLWESWYPQRILGGYLKCLSYFVPTALGLICQLLCTVRREYSYLPKRMPWANLVDLPTRSH